MLKFETKYCRWQGAGKRLREAFLFFSVFVLASCGYTLNHRLQSTFRSPSGIFVPVFDNRTQEVGTEIVFTNALIRELLSHGEKVAHEKAKNPSEQSIELHGTVTQVQRNVEVQSAAGLPGLVAYQRVPDQIGIRAFILMELKNAKTGKVIWQKEFSAYQRVSAPLDRTQDGASPSSLANTTESIIESVYPLIARDIMRDVYDSMVEVF